MKLALFTIFAFFSTSAMALSTPCSLLSTPLPDGLLNESQLQNYKDKLKSECALSEAYKNLKSELQNKYGLSPTQISEYQAMRYIRRVDFEYSKKKEIPVEKTYQVKREMYQLPNEQKSTIIWDNWINGLKQLEPAVLQLGAGSPFSVEALKKIHIGFYQLADEIGDDANAPDVGVFKPAVPNDNYWWDFPNESEALQAKNVVDKINAMYAAMGLLPHFKNETLNRVLDVRLAVKQQPPESANKIEYVYAIFAGHTQANQTHIKNIMGFMNSMVQSALQNKPLIWNSFVMTPGEVAYFVQKFYIGVHPFSDGNGRTSRFIQEMLLTLFELPHGSSGDLMDSDVLSLFSDYYYKAINANIELLKKTKGCLEAYSKVDLASVLNGNQTELDYSCRVLKYKK